jgi:hypothetical protein
MNLVAKVPVFTIGKKISVRRVVVQWNRLETRTPAVMARYECETVHT